MLKSSRGYSGGKENNREDKMEKLQVSRQEVHKLMREDECTLLMAFFKIVLPHIDEFYDGMEECITEERLVNEFLKPYVEVV